MRVYENSYFYVGLEKDYYSIIFHRENVLVLPVVDDSHILFIRAVRPLLDESSVELPAGNVDKGETLKQAALRELYEETGIKVEDESRLVSFPPLNLMPNRTVQKLNIFQVNISRDEYSRREPHDDEVEGLLLLAFNEVIYKIRQGEINAGAAVATSLFYLINRTISN